jgi:hypothetical protein
VEDLLERTLRSIGRQQHPDFCTIVVGNQAPAFDLDPTVRFVGVDFPVPSPVRGPRTDRDSFVLDKGTKLVLAIAAARQAGATHYMTADADDYFSRRLSELVAAGPDADGWYVEAGYQYSERRRLIRRIPHGFADVCGSSLLYRADQVDFPSLPLSATQAEVLEACGTEAVCTLLGSHRFMRDHCAARGRPLAPTPFPGAVYNVDTAENHSGTTLTRFGRPVSAALSEEFGLPIGGMPESLRAMSGLATVPAGMARRLLQRAPGVAGRS